VRVAGVGGRGVDGDSGSAEAIGEFGESLLATGDERDCEAFAAEAGSDGGAESGAGAEDKQVLGVDRRGAGHGS
jgi:hypothetical protein